MRRHAELSVPPLDERHRGSGTHETLLAGLVGTPPSGRWIATAVRKKSWRRCSSSRTRPRRSFDDSKRGGSKAGPLSTASDRPTGVAKVPLARAGSIASSSRPASSTTRSSSPTLLRLVAAFLRRGQAYRPTVTPWMSESPVGRRRRRCSEATRGDLWRTGLHADSPPSSPSSRSAASHPWVATGPRGVVIGCDLSLH